MTSNFTVDGERWELDAPPLDIAYAYRVAFYSSSRANYGDVVSDILYEEMNASGLWANEAISDQATIYRSSFYSTTDPAGRDRPFDPQLYVYDGESFSESHIRDTGRCIADDNYSWGFSSLLLFIFCCYTLLFSITLILLQADVYHNSRSAREVKPHSIYRDILFLANELRAKFGQDAEFPPCGSRNAWSCDLAFPTTMVNSSAIHASCTAIGPCMYQ